MAYAQNAATPIQRVLLKLTGRAILAKIVQVRGEVAGGYKSSGVILA
jgi:hypothetical protein